MNLQTHKLLQWAGYTLKQYSVFITVASVTVMLITMISTQRSPKIYAATTTAIYGQGSSGGGLSFSGMSVQGIGLSMGGQNAINGLLIREILLSMSMSKDIIRKFNLIDRLNAPNEYIAYLKLRKMVKIVNFELKSLISVTVQFPDPQLAADIANFYFENLNIMNDRLKLSTDRDIVSILDPAEAPLYYIGPFVKTNMFISLIATAFLSSLLILLINLVKLYRRSMSPQETF